MILTWQLFKPFSVKGLLNNDGHDTLSQTKPRRMRILGRRIQVCGLLIDDGRQIGVFSFCLLFAISNLDICDKVMYELPVSSEHRPIFFRELMKPKSSDMEICISSSWNCFRGLILIEDEQHVLHFVPKVRCMKCLTCNGVDRDCRYTGRLFCLIYIFCTIFFTPHACCFQLSWYSINIKVGTLGLVCRVSQNRLLNNITRNTGDFWICFCLIKHMILIDLTKCFILHSK